jgi:hypothetical protein
MRCVTLTGGGEGLAWGRGDEQVGGGRGRKKERMGWRMWRGGEVVDPYCSVSLS